jgi:hypothetical protein
MWAGGVRGCPAEARARLGPGERRRPGQLGYVGEGGWKKRKKREGEKGKGRWAGPREKEREERREIQIQRLLNLKLKLEFK